MENDNNNNDLEKKQAFLRTEIMEKNYDPEKFSEFLSKFKENGLDLSNWTFEELQQVVNQFQNNNNINKNNKENSEEKGIENVRNSFIIDSSLVKEIQNNNKNNPYDKIFDEKNEEEFGKIQNVMSDLSINDEDKHINNNINENNKKRNDTEVGGFILVDSDEIYESKQDIITCIKQKENSISNINNLYVILSG